MEGNFEIEVVENRLVAAKMQSKSLGNWMKATHAALEGAKKTIEKAVKNHQYVVQLIRSNTKKVEKAKLTLEALKEAKKNGKVTATTDNDNVDANNGAVDVSITTNRQIGKPVVIIYLLSEKL